MPKHAANDPNGASFDAQNARGARQARSDGDEHVEPTEASSSVSEPEGSAGAEAAGAGAHAGGFSYQGDNEDEYPNALESLEPHLEPSILIEDATLVDSEASRGRHAKGGKTGKEGKGESKDAVPHYLRKSRRMRRLLTAVVVLLVLLIAALAYFAFMLVQESHLLATQQTQEQQSTQDVGALQDNVTDDADTQTEKTTDAPDLVALLGQTQEQAIEALQRGATVTSSREVNEEGNPIKASVTLALTSEPADARTGTPSVYLGLDESGAIVQAGYSASTAALGYGTLSFSDAVENEHIVEKTLQEAGIDVAEGTVELPEDKMEYSTYASDGTTLVKESCSFTGTADIDGVSHEWSAVLSYDYSTANATGNLSDTIRIVYVYINA